MIAVPTDAAELAGLVENLAAAPRLLAELDPLLRQVEVPVGEVTALVRRDPGLTARLISVANSAAYAREEPATSLEDAVACIGYQEVYRLVGALAAARVGDEPLLTYGITSQRFRENAVFVALVSEELAGAIGGEPRTAYTIGLLRSIGKVALDRCAKAAGISPRPRADAELLLAWEGAEWTATSPEAGAKILRHWRFPDAVVRGVRRHFAPGPTDGPLDHLLNLAAGAADVRGFGVPGEENYWTFSPESFAITGVDEGKLVWAGERAFRALHRIHGALG